MRRYLNPKVQKSISNLQSERMIITTRVKENPAGTLLFTSEKLE